MFIRWLSGCDSRSLTHTYTKYNTRSINKFGSVRRATVRVKCIIKIFAATNRRVAQGTYGVSTTASLRLFNVIDHMLYFPHQLCAGNLTLYTMNALSNPPPGGFIPTTLPSPPPSTITSPRQNPSTLLPHPRAHPLKSGSAKESGLISFVDQGILNVARRYAKRFSARLEDGPVEPGVDADAAAGLGYEEFGEVARDLEELVDVVWVSGTRTFFLLFLLLPRPSLFDCLRDVWFRTNQDGQFGALRRNRKLIRSRRDRIRSGVADLVPAEPRVARGRISPIVRLRAATDVPPLAEGGCRVFVAVAGPRCGERGGVVWLCGRREEGQSDGEGEG